MHTKTKIKHNYTLTRMAIIKKIDNIKFGKDVEDWNPHTFLVGM